MQYLESDDGDEHIAAAVRPSDHLTIGQELHLGNRSTEGIDGDGLEFQGPGGLRGDRRCGEKHLNGPRRILGSLRLQSGRGQCTEEEAQQAEEFPMERVKSVHSNRLVFFYPLKARKWMHPSRMTARMQRTGKLLRD